MSELVLIASDLYGAASDVPHRTRGVSLRYLSRIARFGTVEPLPAGWRAWLAAWLGREDLASAAPASIAGVHAPAPRERGQQFLWLADPVHLIVGPTSVHLPANGRLALDADTQQALASAFGDWFAQSGYSLEPLRGGGLLARGPAPPGEVQTTEPARVLGTSIASALPGGPGAAALRTVGAEIEMWLHEHPLNARRVRESRPPISTLWLWGGGPSLEPRLVPPPESPLEQAVRVGPSDSPGAAIFGDDSFMEGLARLSGAHFGAAPPDLPALGTGISERCIVALELLRSNAGSSEMNAREIDPFAALERFEHDWVAPALAQLRRGDLGRLTIVANDRRLSIGSRDRFRFWRRPRAALAVLR